MGIGRKEDGKGKERQPRRVADKEVNLVVLTITRETLDQKFPKDGEEGLELANSRQYKKGLHNKRQEGR